MRKRILIPLVATLAAAACSLTPPRQSGEPARASGHHSVRASGVNSEAVAIARDLVGAPYRYGGAGPTTFDCSGLVYYAYGRAGAAVPRTTKALYRAAKPVNPRKLQPGDLIFFQIGGRISHVGIYAGGGRFIHAPSSGKEVTVGRLSSPYWRDHLIAAGRLSAR
jgi:murein DD-endopeptidase